MQAITGSIGLSLPSTEAGGVSDLSSDAGGDMASGLGFLSLFTTQLDPASTNLEANLRLSDLLKGQGAGGDLDGNLFPQGLPLRSLFSQQNLFGQFLSGKGGEGLADGKLFSNISSEVFSSQGFLEAIQGDGEPDSFTQSLLQELGSSALRGKGSQTGAGFAAITSQLGNQGWGDELVSRVKWQIGQQIQEAKISLNPRELGPLQIKISINDDQAHVQFVAHHGSVRDAIEDAIPRLREMLEQAGLMLADANVSQQSPDQRGAFSEDADSAKDQLQENGMEGEEQEHSVKVVRAGVGLVDAFI